MCMLCTCVCVHMRIHVDACSINAYRIRRNIGESNIWRNSATYVSADLILANITCIHTHTFARILLVD